MIPENVVEQAQNADLVDFISRYYGFSFKGGGGFRAKEHPSLTIASDRRGWAWHSQNLSGYGAISFLVKVEGMIFTKAVEEIVGYSVAQAPVSQPPEPPKVLQLPPHAPNCNRIWNYLCHVRQLDPSVVRTLIERGLIYQDNRNNAVFLGLDT